MKTQLKNFKVVCLEDSDGHLNIYIESVDGADVEEIYTGQGDGKGEQLALRFTTPNLEQLYIEGSK